MDLIFDDYELALVEGIKMCWEQNATLRLSASEILSFLQDYEQQINEAFKKQ